MKHEISSLIASLPPVARYFPFEKGIYEVAPGLRSFGTDFGNGVQDQRVFQFDQAFETYYRNKQTCIEERATKYIQTKNLSPHALQAAKNFFIQRLPQEHPDCFELRTSYQDGQAGQSTQSSQAGQPNQLYCRLTDTTLNIEDSNFLDHLGMQIQEDFAIMEETPDGMGALTYLHLCSPSHWSAEDKIGKSFVEIHLPVPDIEKINRAAKSFMDAMIDKGPYVRFVWGFGTDHRLNHHPIAPPGIDSQEWKGRVFDASLNPPVIMRMERQVTMGLPQARATLFFIRVYFIDGNEIKSDERKRSLLRSSLLSMNEKALQYKGLQSSLPQVIEWIDS